MLGEHPYEVQFPLNCQASAAQTINPKIDHKVENSGAVGEIDFKNEFIVLMAKADVKKPTAAVAKMTDGDFDITNYNYLFIYKYLELHCIC